MSTGRFATSRRCRCKASVLRDKEHPAPGGASKVLAERNPAVAAVGAWVEDGQDFTEHPCTLASLTEEIQAERRRETEESLRRFQDEVRHCVAQRAQVSKRSRQPQPDLMVQVKPDRRILQQQLQRRVWTRRVSAGERLTSAGGAAHQRSSQECNGGVRQVRLRLASRRMINPCGETTSDLPGGRWNVSPTRHRAGSHVLRAEQKEEEEEGDDRLFATQHECPLVLQKVGGPVALESDKSQPDAGCKSNLRVQQVLWPLTDHEQLKRQRQSQFLMQRRLYMNTEREQVKDSRQNRKHLKRTERMKAEKEQFRLEEERKMERVRQLEERELLIVERLKLEEEEERAEQLRRRRKREEKGKAAARFIEALRAQMKERLSQEKLEPPPLCCCASSFWDSHPDTCANNCVFHSDPRAYAEALHSALMGLESQHR